jgi:hypothetical protein
VGSQEISDTSFGIFIAYLLPGLTAIYGLPIAADGQFWATLAASSQLTFPQIALVLVTALAAGLTVSTVRWLVVDTIHHQTGLRPGIWDFSRLGENVAAFEFLNQIHYRYHKFYANMVVALAWAYAAGGFALGWRGLAYWALAGLFFLGSRDALGRYYDRVGLLLAPPPRP